jgi:CubicO group peptidase (beta-lactamase class C family)
VSGLAAQDQFSGTVLLGCHGQPVLVRSYQDADKAKNIPNQAGTIFYLDSVTKFLTGGFPSTVADTVTVHNLLTHTSGYPAGQTGAGNSWKTRSEAFNSMLALLRKQQLVATCSGRILGHWFDLGLRHRHDRHSCLSRWLTGCW